MIEYVFHSQQLEWECHHKDIVWWIAALNYMETVAEVNPPRVQTLPEQGINIFPHISQGAVAVCGCRMSINVHPAQTLVPFLNVLAPGA